MGGGKFANGAATAAFQYTLSTPLPPTNDASQSPDVATRAKLAAGVYDEYFTGADGYQLFDRWDNPETGLQAALFVKGDSYIVAYAGTSPSSWANWSANLTQALGLESSQYTLGIDIANRLQQQYGSNLSFTGHSLGGGIAAAAAAVTGLDAVVFNAAGVNSATVGRYGATLSGAPVTHYYSALDVLQAINAVTPVHVPGSSVSLGPAGLHGMSGVCRAVGC